MSLFLVMLRRREKEGPLRRLPRSSSRSGRPIAPSTRAIDAGRAAWMPGSKRTPADRSGSGDAFPWERWTVAFCNRLLRRTVTTAGGLGCSPDARAAPVRRLETGHEHPRPGRERRIYNLLRSLLLAMAVTARPIGLCRVRWVITGGCRPSLEGTRTHRDFITDSDLPRDRGSGPLFAKCGPARDAGGIASLFLEPRSVRTPPCDSFSRLPC